MDDAPDQDDPFPMPKDKARALLELAKRQRHDPPGVLWEDVLPPSVAKASAEARKILRARKAAKVRRKHAPPA